MLKSYIFNQNCNRLVSKSTSSVLNGVFIKRSYSTSEENATESTESTTTEEVIVKKPIRTMQDDLNIEDTIKTVKTKIIAMPFEYSYQSFYKNKRTTKKGINKMRAHLKAFGAVPYVFPESMFRDIKAPVPLSEVNKNSNVTKQQQQQ